MLDGGKERGVRIPPELVAEHAERAWGVAKVPGHLGGGPIFEEVGAKGFIHALFWVGWFLEEPSTLN
jgi:hypothetical protein